MDSREERIGQNEALFRQINERLEALQQPYTAIADQADFVCECGDMSCAQHITMSVQEYEHVRADARTFAVVPGHEIPDVETVVEHHGHYDIVRKHPGETSTLAIDADPRD